MHVWPWSSGFGVLGALVVVPGILPFAWDLNSRISDFSQVEQVMKCIVILAALVVAAFCTFGFAATFEPLDRGQQLTGRAVYGAGFLASIVVVAWTLVKGRRARSAGR